MSNRTIFAILGGLLIAIPLLLLLFFYVWFQTQFVHLGDWEDTDLIETRWAVAQTLNTCRFDITQRQRLIGYVHPRYIWERTPNSWPRGEGASEVFKPNGTQSVVGDTVVNTARVFIKKKDGGPVIDIVTQNSLSVRIPDGTCQLFK
ncbi:MAG: hypothetical protein AB8G95_21805 [Anaerolineae bacterium]